MARKEGNPLQTLMIVQVALLVGLIAIYVFWNKKTDGEKVGYFLPDETPTPTAVATAPNSTNPVATTTA